MKKVTLLVGTLILAGCSGTMQGVIRGEGTPVQFSYEQGMDSDQLTAVIDGEQFRGRSVMDGAASTFGTGFGTAFDMSGGAYSGMTNYVGYTTTGDFTATLLGSRGSTLRCDLDYADSSGLTNVGGVGVCQHSDGRIIDVVW
ncbi:hypothetical protein [Wenxinia saemankumensis]|uniref:Uncharacterized protein n=1 Tax=Wenxinia saemankumensis TaxID=1447782 RepID=A0A1M6HQQ9_9RHOB|nr:hypothetical protein [Wenxinia saemankumensis]SHJ24525.1 hypothetical protein SAMN05444417_3299 [Wenxinia saemankumensis]